MKLNELNSLVQDAVSRQLTETELKPIGPNGAEITDPTVLRNLQMAVRAVGSNIRPKLIDLINDPEAAKDLKSPQQKAAVIGAIAIAFGITEHEFSEIIGKIKGVLNKTA